MSEQAVLTVGHSNHEADHFVGLLEGQEVETLVDVRRFPGSRRVPWTRSEELEARLAALWWRCHRRLIADALLVNGRRVLHLDGRGELDEHALTEFAKVDGGALTYPDPQLSLE